MNYILRVHTYPRLYQKHIRTSAYREEGNCKYKLKMKNLKNKIKQNSRIAQMN